MGGIKGRGRFDLKEGEEEGKPSEEVVAEGGKVMEVGVEPEEGDVELV